MPCVSLRGALFRELKANASAFPIKQVFHDRHHPSAWGHSLMAQMVVTLVEGAIDHQRSSAIISDHQRANESDPQRALAAAQPSSSSAVAAVAAAAEATAAAAATTPAVALPPPDALHIGPTCSATLREHGGLQLNAPLYAESP